MERSEGKYQARLAAVVNIHQIAVQVQVLPPPHLHRGVRRRGGLRARRELEAGEEAAGRDRDLGEGLGGEVGGGVGGKDDFLDVGVRGLGPEGFERCHFWWLEKSEVRWRAGSRKTSSFGLCELGIHEVRDVVL